MPALASRWSPGELLPGAVLAFVVAAVTTPAGVSAATLLLPVQVTVLDVPNPALTPTNPLFNVIATPGALLRLAREGRLRSPLTARLLVGTVPGVVVGAALRVEVLDGTRAFLVPVAAVLAPVGASLLLRPAQADTYRGPGWTPTGLALGVEIVGGIYGTGGGSLLGPLLSLLGLSIAAVAPAALPSTWATSVVGVAAFAVLQQVKRRRRHHAGMAARPVDGRRRHLRQLPRTRLQVRIPEQRLRRGLRILSLVLAARYLLDGLGVARPRGYLMRAPRGGQSRGPTAARLTIAPTRVGE